MAKRNRITTAKTIEKRLAEGRGQGRGVNYIPYLKVHDVSSNGISSRISGWTTLRTHHLLSKIETATFYVFDWAERIKDIREQYPLLPIDETLAIAESLCIRHPIDCGS